MIVDPETGVISHFVRTPYNYDRDLVSSETALRCPEPTRTQQQFKDECDINTIMKNFGVTGHLPIMATQPLQGDFTSIGTFQEAMNAVMEAEANFLRLPSATREKFGNDPRKFVDFCVDPANIEAVREMGLAPRKENHGENGNDGKSQPGTTNKTDPAGSAGTAGN